MNIEAQLRLKKVAKAFEKENLPVPCITLEENGRGIMGKKTAIVIWSKKPSSDGPVFECPGENALIAIFEDDFSSKFGDVREILAPRAGDTKKMNLTPLAALRLISSIAKNAGFNHSWAGFSIDEENGRVEPVINLFTTKPEYRTSEFAEPALGYHQKTEGWLPENSSECIGSVSPLGFIGLDPAVDSANLKELLVHC